ncbi:GDP-mannose mannosyl hydrolase [Acinetobacter guerrae]|uniref:GDP-mannose mannosyl hydrolase n=1 Tax=Acinetobacter guerrae TaxID=1843371 RepID=A0A3A8EDY0_9GAMM|nr:GDP-mannose mannosyl hydrolase [Acinetobacter guerrae]RKG33162.1 GDP-mannose mannosyl hydrolase [Acinetobacter guerrae]
MWLSDQLFKTVITSTPLISIDLIVRNNQNQVLLGKRLNAPAKNFWFVPGGRIQKNETLDGAFSRLLKDELGIQNVIHRSDANFLGLYEHFYDDNFFDQTFSTHYIVLSYEIVLKQTQLEDFPKFQHEDYMWISENQLLIANEVHQYTQNYFK